MNTINLSVVLPCRNEGVVLRQSLLDIKNVLDRMSVSTEIVVVDNNSTDNTAQIAREEGASVVYEGSPGYGSALRKGFEEAQGEVIVYFDPDGSYNPSYIPLLYSKILAGSELVLATRLGGKIMPGAMPWLHQYLGTPVLTWLIRVLFCTTITDCNSGYRMFKKSSLNLNAFASHGMEFSSEMCIETCRQGLKYSEIPIIFVQDRRGHKPHLRTWRDGMRHLLLILKKRIQR